MNTSLADSAGTYEIAGRKIARLGFGAMRLTVPDIRGEPEDRTECVRVVRHAVELGVQLIDTANSYGPCISEETIRESIHPYPDEKP
ncbi:aldo/keto reductase [Streptomyces sp. MMBL 11-3]|uniref:aldo/keto reductase n=1 Tax=Streptomyces sp. MMBL 11-3 TaxID=3382639 RepID=UPI0039B5E6D5